jgi:hypothetical protein
MRTPAETVTGLWYHRDAGFMCTAYWLRNPDRVRLVRLHPNTLEETQSFVVVCPDHFEKWYVRRHQL